MKASWADHGLTVGPAEVAVLYSDDERGAWLLIATDHDAVEVHVTPKGRKVTATSSHLRRNAIASWEDTDNE